MSLFSGPEEHAANPPESWVVVKMHTAWRLLTADGNVLARCKTKREAEKLKTEGFYAELYRDETRWYAGERVRNWKLYSEMTQ